MGNTDQFEKVAHVYDTPERLEITRIISDAIRHYLVDTGSKNAIDFGCGTGLVGLNLLNEFSSVLFIDSSPNMIHQLKQKITDLHIQNVDTLCVDIEKGAVTDLNSDYIFMSQVLLHIREVEIVLSRLFEMLNDDGHLLIVDFVKNEKIDSDLVHNGFIPQELANVLINIGFGHVQFHTFYSGSKIFMGHDASMFILDARKGQYMSPI